MRCHVNTEIVYLGHDNTVDVILKADGVAVDLAPVTSMTLTVGTVLISSDNTAGDPILWVQGGYATGEVHIAIGGESITAGVYLAPLVVYDPTNLDGVVWGTIPLRVLADPEGAVTP
jgi:hypothetical protein